MKLLSSKIKAYLAAVSALNMILSLISVVSTYLMARVLQYAQTGDWRQTWGAILVCIGFLALSVAANIGCDALGQAMYGQARQDLRSSIMKSIFARPVSMFRERDDAYYFNLLTTDATTFCSDFLATIPMLVSWLGRIAACAVMLYFLHPVLMAVSLLASALPLLAQNVFNDLSTKAKNAFSAASEQYTAVMKETVEGYELIRMDGGKHRLLQRFDDYSQKECKKRMRSNFISCLSFQFFITSASLVQFIGLGTGAWLIAAGKLDAVLMIAAVNYVVQISNGFGNVIEYVTTVRSVKDIRKKLEREAEMQGPPAAASAGRRTPFLMRMSASPLASGSSTITSTSPFSREGAMHSSVKAAAANPR